MDQFSNLEVEIGSLPKTEELVLQPIEPSYKKVIIWGWLFGWGIVFLAVTSALFLFPTLQTFLCIMSIVCPLIFFSFLNLWLSLKSLKIKAYAVREKDIVYRRGWIVQRISICPFNRIQHCSVSANPFERKLGLATLSIFTAGTQGSDMKIPGLHKDTAAALRDFIMKKTSQDEGSTE